MRQSRLMSLFEAVINVVVGIIVAVSTQLIVFPILGLNATLGQTSSWRLSSPARPSWGATRSAAVQRRPRIPDPWPFGGSGTAGRFHTALWTA